MWPTIPPDTATWWYFTAVGLAMLIIGLSKAGFGGGIAIIAVPLVANALPADRAVGLMLPLLIVADLFSNAAHFRQQSNPHLRWLLAGALVGILTATTLMVFLQETGRLVVTLNLSVGLLCLLFVAIQAYRLLGGHIPRIPPGPWGGRSSGLLAGLTSTLAHSAGPVVSIYLLEQRLGKRLFVGTMVLFFAILNLAKLPTYLALGLINPATLLEGLWCLPLIPLGVLIGLWLHNRVPEKPFTVIIYLGAAAAAVNMLYNAFAP